MMIFTARSFFMRKSLIVLLAVLSMTLGFVGTASAGVFTTTLAAQEGTPVVGDSPITVIELAPGVTAEVFAGAPSDRAPGQTVYLGRFVFQPDAELLDHGHPGTTVVGVASGSLGWTLEAGTAYVIRGAAAGATGPAEQLTEPGTEVILEPGDAIYYEDDVIHTARGASEQETVVFGALVLTSEEPLLTPADMDMSATPEG
jgi:quercetin dioxygenase-like cupin family protein